ncbi:MAG: protein tyrosine/serine phosphatase [Acidimicrobiaceae bacterium]|nr:protein tyrosine/serine phosphatase [Acidimicrobiaceae bacterium]
MALLRSLGVATVVDLRSPSEVARTGSAFRGDPFIRFVNSSVLSSDVLNEPRDEESMDDQYLARRYLHYLEVGGDAFTRAFEEMSHEENYPLVFNCFFGKDRTGVLAALVLSCLGVERSSVVDDYALTATRVPLIVERLRTDPLYRDTVERTNPVVFSATTATMSRFLDEVDQRFGGARGWALGAGVSRRQLDRISHLLLE